MCETDRHGWLKFKQLVSDFELEFEYRIPPGGNSGILFRYPGTDSPATTSLEAQIIDDDHSRFRVTSRTRTGALYGISGPSVSKARSSGQWNKMRIRCLGNDVTIWVNEEVASRVDLSNWGTLRNRPASGYIGISNWRGQAKGMVLRDLRLLKLDDTGIGGFSAPSSGKPNQK